MNGVEMIGNFGNSYYSGADDAIDGVKFIIECSKPIREVIQTNRASYFVTKDGEVWACGAGKQSLVKTN